MKNINYPTFDRRANVRSEWAREDSDSNTLEEFIVDGYINFGAATRDFWDIPELEDIEVVVLKVYKKMKVGWHHFDIESFDSNELDLIKSLLVEDFALDEENRNHKWDDNLVQYGQLDPLGDYNYGED